MPLDMKTMSNWAGKCQVGFGMEMCLNNAQKQPTKNFLKKFCNKIFFKFRNTHRKTTALESVFNKKGLKASNSITKRDSNTGIFLRIFRNF